VRGTGTVATGTVWSGMLRVDAQVRIEPSGLSARVRGLQHHGVATDSIAAGERAAVALAGVDRDALQRGDTLLCPGWAASSILTVRLVALRDAPDPLRTRQRVRVHLGTAEVLGRLALPGGALEPGGTTVAQLRLERPVVCRGRDRFVIRSYSPVHTVAGGTVLEPLAPKRKRLSPELEERLLLLGSPGRALGALLALAGPAGVAVGEVPILIGVPPAEARALVETAAARQVADRIIAATHLEDCRAAILREVRAFHEATPLEEGIDREALRRLVGVHAPIFDAVLRELLDGGTLHGAGSAVAMKGFRPTAGAADAAALDRLAAYLESVGLEAPDLSELGAALLPGRDLQPLLRHLERQGRAIRLSASRWASADAVSAAASALVTQVQPGVALGIADFRELLGLSRKHLIPLLEYFDRMGVTRRDGDARLLAQGPSCVTSSHPDGAAAEA
jgi:selenocysteine-specific elongation factor